jgi:hypothetical protein
VAKTPERVGASVEAMPPTERVVLTIPFEWPALMVMAKREDVTRPLGAQ